MPKSSKNIISADEIAEKASRGKNISAYFTNKFTVVKPIQRTGKTRRLKKRTAR